MKLRKDYTKGPFLYLVNDALLPSDNPLRFSKNLQEFLNGRDVLLEK